MSDFAPTREAARARIAAIDPRRYARTRNALDGHVTRLSPYLTHGIVDTVDVARGVARRHPLTHDDRLVMELGWREFFAHVRAHAGDAVLSDAMRSPATGRGCDHDARVLPDDLLEARTGVPAIDTAVRTLYATGWLHNHARMWLASYATHLRKVHWRAGADWMVSYLLDGDLASNHLSWQWVAGTFSSKPYLFNADNVEQFAGSERPAWESRGTQIDRSYDALDRIARSDIDVGPEPRTPPGTPPPPCYAHPPGVVGADRATIERATSGERVVLMHPWALRDPPLGALAIGVVHVPYHTHRPWTAARWAFVVDRMQSLCRAIFVGDAAELADAMRAARRVELTACPESAYTEALASCVTGIEPVRTLYPRIEIPMPSFSRFHAASRSALRATLASYVVEEPAS